MGEVDDHERDYRARLGHVLQELRAIRRVSQAYLAEALGRSEAAVSRWETGKATPSAYDLVKVSMILDAPPELLLSPPAIEISPLAHLLHERAIAAERTGRVRAAHRLVNEAAEQTSPRKPARGQR